MLLSELLDSAVDGARNVEVLGLTADSREVRPGYLFAALRGSHADGADYVADALVRGAVVVLAADEPRLDVPADRALLVADANPRRRLALMAARFYGVQPDVVAAVTGTSGKTSVADFLRQIWTHSGHAAASLGTLGVIGVGVARKLPHTTPDPVTLHQCLAGIAGAGIDHLAIEASSHGLDQCRMDGVRVAAGAFTNLSRDHLDYHPTLEHYLAAKLHLFDTVMAPGGTALINVDAPEYARVRETCEMRGHRVVGYGRGACDLQLVSATADGDGQRLTVVVDGARRDLAFPLAADYQALNAVCAAGLAIATGVAADAALGALEDLAGVPGRIELVARHPSSAPIYVDYSHKPDALANVLRALRPQAIGRLVVVFGCGGDRDRAKRPMMGEIAAALGDWPIVTDDNPRTEDPVAIRREILAGCPDATEIGDRADAIGAAVAGLAAGDVLVIAGKGHEQGQIIGDRVIPFDDATAARYAVAALESAAP